MTLGVTVTCAEGADYIKRSICRLAVNAVSKYDRGEGNRDTFFCLNQALGQTSEQHRCVWSPQGLDYLMITTSSVLPLLLFFFPGSDTKKWFTWSDWLTKNCQPSALWHSKREYLLSAGIWPLMGQCQQIKCFLDELGSCSSRCVYISSALFTGNLKPKA